MTKKDYITIASVLRHRRFDLLEDNPAGLRSLEITCLSLADRFEVNNSRFDRDKFLRACGVV